MINNNVRVFHKRYNKAVQLNKEGKLEECIELSKTISPNKETYLLMGNTYKSLDNWEAAEECWQKCLDPLIPSIHDARSKKPLLPALNNLGILRYDQHNEQESIGYFAKLAEQTPNFGSVYWNASFPGLKLGYSKNSTLDLKSSWDLYEWRLKEPEMQKKLGYNVKFWDGVSFCDKLIVIQEQGQGDVINFARYLPCLEPYYGEIVLYLYSKTLNCLFPDYTISNDSVEGDRVVTFGSLPGLFPGSYPHDWFKWNEQKVPESGTINIAVEWQGSTDHQNNKWRSVDPEYFKRLLLPGVKLWNLRPDSDCPPWINKIETTSWLDTASYLNGMDLLVSVDTSIVHLAGTMGVTTWMLNPLNGGDWRWGTNSSGYWNYWYPTLSIFRNPRDWNYVFDNVKRKLTEILND